MRTTLPLLLTATITLVAGAAAQRSIVIPAANAANEGSTRILFPFAGTAALRYQQVLHMGTNVGAISQVGCRRDNDVIVASGNYQAFAVDIDVTLSTSPRTPTTISAFYQNNLSNDARMVHSGVLNWPAENKLPPGPTGFVYTVPIPQPFVFTGPGALCLDISRRAFPNPNNLFFLDADGSAVGTGIRVQGAGCPNATVNQVVVYDNWAPGATARIQHFNAANNSPALLVIGDNNVTLGGLLLPLDLGVIGAPGCLVYQNQVFAIPGTNTAAATAGPYMGRWDFRFEIPNLPGLGGIKVFTQFLNLSDPTANAAGISVSTSHEITIAIPVPGKPEVSESHGSSLTAAESQLVQQGYGFIVELKM